MDDRQRQRVLNAIMPDLAATIYGETVALMASGQVPLDVREFHEVHDFVDGDLLGDRLYRTAVGDLDEDAREMVAEAQLHASVSLTRRWQRMLGGEGPEELDAALLEATADAYKPELSDGARTSPALIAAFRALARAHAAVGLLPDGHPGKTATVRIERLEEYAESLMNMFNHMNHIQINRLIDTVYEASYIVRQARGVLRVTLNDKPWVEVKDRG